MTRTRTLRAVATATLLAGVLLLTAGPATAHGISGAAADRSTIGFVTLGIEHMILGWDHLLFVAGVLLLAGSARLSAKLISAFVVGHSTTLIAASLAGWRVSPGAVDVVIALSVALVGAIGMVGRPRRWDVFAGAVFVFGLVHGLGLATRVRDLGLPEDGLVWKVIAFNVGIEIGQLTAIIGMLGLAVVLAMTFDLEKPNRLSMATKVGATAFFATGAMAAPLIAYESFKDVDGEPTDVAFAESSTCRTGPRTETLPATGGHPTKRFFEPSETPPLADFGHALGDGYIVVLYPQTATAADLTQLRDFSATEDGRAVLAAQATAPSADFKAITARETLTCQEFELEPLRTFSSQWLSNLS